jgi:hypothetical protein
MKTPEAVSGPRTDEGKALLWIAGKCLEALEPELERRDLVRVIRTIYDLASDFDDEEDDDVTQDSTQQASSA